MATISDYLTSISNSKKAIKTAIKNKSVAIDDTTPLADYAGKIDSIKAGDDSIARQLIDRSITSLVIPTGITTIGDGALAYSYRLQSVVIPDSVTTINCNAFYATALQSVTIPDSVTEIKMSAFSGCNVMQTLKIGSGVTKMGTMAFNRGVYNKLCK